MLTTAIAIFLTAASGFYVCFFVALCKDCKPKAANFRMFLHLKSPERTVVALAPRSEEESRAA